MLDRIKSVLGRKVAGIPLLYFVGFGVIGLAVYAWQTGTLSADDAATEDIDPTGNDTPEGDAAGVDQPVFVANPSVQVGPATDPSLTDPVSVDTNELWLRRAVTWLSGSGAATGNTANNALSKYLNGDTLSYDEGVLRDLAIKQYGLPPDPPGESTTSPKPAVPVKTVPASKQFTHFPGTHTIKGASDNTYTELTMLYYGRKDSESVDLLQAANPGLGHAGPWPIGTKVKIPAYHAPKYYTATSATRTGAAIAKKNGISQAVLADLNDGIKFPVAIGKRVRVA